MNLRYRLIVTFLGLLFCVNLNAQDIKDSLINELDKASTPEIKIEVLKKLSAKIFPKNNEDGDDFINKAIFIAEETRNVELMIKARLNGASIYINYGYTKLYLEKAKVLLLEGIGFCKDVSKYNKLKIRCLNALSSVNGSLGSIDESIKNMDASLHVCLQLNDDSFSIATHHIYSQTLLNKGEKLNALKQLLAAQNIADFSKHKSKDWLISKCQSALANYYTTIEDYDKALDFYYKGIEYAKKNGNNVDEIQLLVQIGDVYIKYKKEDNAINTYEKVIELAKKYNKDDYIIYGKAGIVNTYANGTTNKEKLLPYLNANPDITAYFKDNGLMHYIHLGLAQIYSLLNKVDSANYYFNLAAPVFETNSGLKSKAQFVSEYGNHFYRSKMYKEAINYLKRSEILCDSASINEGKLNAYQYLDSSYRAIGDLKNAIFYNDKYNALKTKIEKDGNEKDLLSFELDNEEKQKVKQAEIDKENTKKRHNIQYTGIIFGILTMFIIFVAVGLFKINAKVVKWLGFISFIFLFEFIILIADNWIHHITHGEPLYVLAIKVVLIALLLPFHHWIEHKVIDYITKRKIVVHHDLADNLKQSI